MTRTTLVSLMAVCGLSSAALAGEDYTYVATSPATQSEEDMELNLRLDGWIVQLDTGISNSALGLSKSVFIGIDDILKNIDWIVPIGADLRYKRLGFMPDLVALKMSGGGTTPGPFFNRADVDLELGVLNLPVYYRAIDKPGFTLDLFAGARYLWVDLDIGLKGGPLGSASAGTDLAVWDGIVGLRVQQDLNDRLFYSVYGDIGTGDSDLTWQVLADLGYRLNDHLSARLGYRYLSYNLGGGGTDLDLTASGPQITINWKF